MEQTAIQQFRSLLTAARSVLIVLPQNPHLDHLAAGLGLYLGLVKNYQVQIVCPTPLTVDHNRLIAVDQVQAHLAGSRQLIFTLPHPAEHIERVFTEVDPHDQTFRIVVEAANQNPGFNSNQVKISSPAEQIDLIILLGARHPDDSDNLLDQLQPLLEQSPVVRIDITNHSPHFTGLELINQQAMALSEITYELLKASQLPLDQDIATNLLAGIEFRTANLADPNVSADTFDIVAACLRLGGIRRYTQISPFETEIKLDEKPASPNAQPSAAAVTDPPPAPPDESAPASDTITSASSPANNGATTSPASSPVTRTPSDSPPTPAQPPARKVVPDWLVPKIFSGQKK